jgi:hypothetical protein
MSGRRVAATGRCLPAPECAAGVEPEPGKLITCLPASAAAHRCLPPARYHRDTGNDDGAILPARRRQRDQIVDERDIPEIVFSSFAGTDYTHNGTLWAISIVDKQVVVKWSKKPTIDPIHPGLSIAGGNIDGLPGNEIVVCTETGKVRAFKADGSSSGPMPPRRLFHAEHRRRRRQRAAGSRRRVACSTARPVRSATLSPENKVNVVLSDMWTRGSRHRLAVEALYKDGSLIADTGLPGTSEAIGDFDKDGVPEVASIDKPTHTLSVWRYDAAEPGKYKVLRTGIDINGTFPNICPAGSSGSTTGGGPPTVADFNGDGTPDVAVAGGIGYAVIDGTKILDPSVQSNQTNLWLSQTKDCSSAATGSSVFDFEGDGVAEVVYSDEHHLRLGNRRHVLLNAQHHRHALGPSGR